MPPQEAVLQRGADYAAGADTVRAVASGDGDRDANNRNAVRDSVASVAAPPLAIDSAPSTGGGLGEAGGGGGGGRGQEGDRDTEAAEAAPGHEVSTAAVFAPSGDFEQGGNDYLSSSSGSFGDDSDSSSEDREERSYRGPLAARLRGDHRGD
jgi:hypothetical protein